MRHFADPSFWQAYSKLPVGVQSLADRQFLLLKRNSRHASLHLKQVGQFWSVRVGIRYRALAVGVSDGLVWFWIGSHAAYDRLVNKK